MLTFFEQQAENNILIAVPRLDNQFELDRIETNFLLVCTRVSDVIVVSCSLRTRKIHLSWSKSREKAKIKSSQLTSSLNLIIEPEP